MIEKIKAFLLPQVVEEPKYWEEAISNTYRILDFQLHLAEEESNHPDFSRADHAKKIRSRLGILKDLVLDRAITERSIFSYPEPFPVESENITGFYIPYVNKVISAGHQVISNGMGEPTTVPNLTTAIDVKETKWCLDRQLVESIATGLISRLPSDSSRRILSKAS